MGVAVARALEELGSEFLDLDVVMLVSVVTQS